jgi:hypothetical protein
MATEKSINPLAVQQAAVSFSTIAELASTVHQMCIEVVAKMGDPEEHAEFFAVAARDLASQIGLLADIGAESLGELVCKGTNPAAWLQPPIYPTAGETSRG